jgi:hypothetical protein
VPGYNRVESETQNRVLLHVFDLSFIKQSQSGSRTRAKRKIGSVKCRLFYSALSTDHMTVM